MQAKISLPLKILAFLKRDFKIATSYRLNFVMQFFGILLSTSSFFLVSRLFNGQDIPQLSVYGGDYFSFVLIGIALTDYLTISTGNFSSEIRNAQIMGTLESLLVSPTSLLTILLSSLGYKLLSTSLRMICYLSFGIIFFGAEFHTANFFLLFLSFILTLLPFLGIGLLSASFIIVFKRGSPLSIIMAMGSGLLSGVLYPVSVLPGWLQPLSELLPITHGLEAIRQILLQGATLSEISTRLYYLAIFSVIFLAIGIYSIYHALNVARQEGSLLHY